MPLIVANTRIKFIVAIIEVRSGTPVLAGEVAAVQDSDESDSAKKSSELAGAQKRRYYGRLYCSFALQFLHDKD
ncbi:MAG: hypothetical protein ABSF50_16690 [Burkholderiaceae bacterium]|jgi:hypothetical protein